MASLRKQKTFRKSGKKANHGSKPAMGKCASRLKRDKLKRMK